MAIENSTGVFQYKLDKLVQVYENDDDLIELLKSYGLYLPDTEEGIPLPERIAQYEAILTVFEENSVEISDNTITELLLIDDIRNQIDIIFYQSVDPIEDDMYRQLLYSYKYGTIKHFFLENSQTFTPSYDAQIIQSQDKIRLWQQAFMKQFDRFAGIIDDILEIQDIDVIAEEYLEYIAQLVGFERGDTSLGESLFREITKNIIEVYRIKGTNYSFELFFNFIGFEIDVIEYWFDKRFYYSNEVVNPYTKENNNFKFAYYLTPIKPTDGYPKGMNTPYVIKDDEITSIRNGLQFDKDMETASEDELKQYLGVDQYEGTKDLQDEDFYSFFKTNIIEYSISKLSSSEILEGLTEEDEATIQSYTNFLTPIFVSKEVVVNVTPFEDDASGMLTMTDASHLWDDPDDDPDMGSYWLSMFIATLAADILAKLAEVNGVETELWDWDLFNMDKFAVELPVTVPADDMTSLQTLPGLYDGVINPIDGFAEIYPYLENKPDTTKDFTLISTNAALAAVPEFMNDIIFMTIKSHEYTASHGGITFGEVETQASYIANPPSGTIFMGGSASTLSSYIFEPSGGSTTSGAAETDVVYNFEASGGSVTSGTAITSYLGYEYDMVGGADTSGSAETYVVYNFEASGQATTSGAATTSGG